jgi:hypothetical protein
MKHVVCELYTPAGSARRSGKGLVMEIAGARFYITPEEILILSSDHAAEVVDFHGEREGTAWFSPLISVKKKELTALIRQKVFIMHYRDIKQVISGDRTCAPVKEFHPEPPEGR